MSSSILKSAAMRLPPIRRLVEQRDGLLQSKAMLDEQGRMLAELPRIRQLVEERLAMLDEQGRMLAELARNVGSPSGPRDEAAHAKIKELTTANAQLEEALKYAGVPAIPPVHLQRRVVGVHHPQFLSSANPVLEQFDDALASVGKRLGDFRSILDYGVGCGRVIRRFRDLYPNADLTGADIDEEAIAWLQSY
jgi:hypothetical protein